MCVFVGGGGVFSMLKRALKTLTDRMYSATVWLRIRTDGGLL